MPSEPAESAEDSWASGSGASSAPPQAVNVKATAPATRAVPNSRNMFRLSSHFGPLADCGGFCLSLVTFPEGFRLPPGHGNRPERSEEHTSELQSRENLVCRLLLEKKKKTTNSS